jgi:hypothetical protein
MNRRLQRGPAARAAASGINSPPWLHAALVWQQRCRGSHCMTFPCHVACSGFIHAMLGRGHVFHCEHGAATAVCVAKSACRLPAALRAAVQAPRRILARERSSCEMLDAVCEFVPGAFGVALRTGWAAALTSDTPRRPLAGTALRWQSQQQSDAVARLRRVTPLAWRRTTCLHRPVRRHARTECHRMAAGVAARSASRLLRSVRAPTHSQRMPPAVVCLSDANTQPGRRCSLQPTHS